MSLPIDGSLPARFAERGYLCPLPALTPEEAARYRRRAEDAAALCGGLGRTILRHKGHLALTWLDELIRHPGVLEPVSRVLGPNILCWTTC